MMAFSMTSIYPPPGQPGKAPTARHEIFLVVLSAGAMAAENGDAHDTGSG